MRPKVAIIGAGLSGLACALELKKNGVELDLFEKNSDIGGRVQTDRVDGFLLDHGFQVFLPSYKMGSYFLNYDQLGLKSFKPGAYIHRDDNFHLISDPLRDPVNILKTLFFPYATLKDKFLILKLTLSISVDHEDLIYDQSTLDFLRDYGFSESVINSFFIPFFSGVFLNKNLNVPSSFFKFLFYSFSKANACIPSEGMQMIPKKMAEEIGDDHIHLNSEVTSDDLLKDSYDFVVIANHQEYQNHFPDLKFYSVKTEYYTTTSNRWAEKTLYLNSSPNSIVNHVACLSAVNPNYAPEGSHLYSVNILDQQNESSKNDLEKLFGKDELSTWKHIKSYTIKKALPSNPTYNKSTELEHPHVAYCGDHVSSPSIQGALSSGYRAAKDYLKTL